MIDAKCANINGIDFIITQEINYNGSNYMLAIDEEKEETIMIFKSFLQDGREMVSSVTDQNELQSVLEIFKRGNV